MTKIKPRQLETLRKQIMTKKDKPEFVTNSGRLLHLIHTQQFTHELMHDFFKIANKARQLYTSAIGASFLKNCLPNMRALLYFVQPSTRTFLSFESAASILGISTAQVTSTRTSSELKGETPLDSVHTFAMYHDLIIIRYPELGFAEQCATQFLESDVSKHIINGGSGMDQHPTQALLDVYTLHREFLKRGGVDGKRIMFVGDLARGRAARSLIYLLCKYSNVKVDLVSPDSLKLKDDMKKYMTKHGINFRESDSMLGFSKEADAVYMTRIQDEYDNEFSPGDINYSAYTLTQDVIASLKPNCIVMHPLPRREEIPISFDADPRSRYWEQVENGMWARVALIAHILECDLKIKSA